MEQTFSLTTSNS